MPLAVTEPPLQADEPPRKKWTRLECEVLEQTGVRGEHRLELVEGDLFNKMGKKRPHSNSLTSAVRWLVGVFGWDYIQQEVPIDVAPQDNATNEPQPDIIVLAGHYQTYRSANPQPEGVRLVVEVADTTLSFDRSVKARLYARAGIVEYWLVDVKGRRLFLHREPRNGEYGSITAYGEHESVAPLAAPDSPCRIADILPLP